MLLNALFLFSSNYEVYEATSASRMVFSQTLQVANCSETFAAAKRKTENYRLKLDNLLNREVTDEQKTYCRTNPKNFLFDSKNGICVKPFFKNKEFNPYCRTGYLSPEKNDLSNVIEVNSNNYHLATFAYETIKELFEEDLKQIPKFTSSSEIKLHLKELLQGMLDLSSGVNELTAYEPIIKRFLNVFEQKLLGYKHGVESQIAKEEGLENHVIANSCEAVVHKVENATGDSDLNELTRELASLKNTMVIEDKKLAEKSLFALLVKMETAQKIASRSSFSQHKDGIKVRIEDPQSVLLNRENVVNSAIDGGYYIGVKKLASFIDTFGIKPIDLYRHLTQVNRSCEFEVELRQALGLPDTTAEKEAKNQNFSQAQLQIEAIIKGLSDKENLNVDQLSLRKDLSAVFDKYKFRSGETLEQRLQESTTDVGAIDRQIRESFAMLIANYAKPIYARDSNNTHMQQFSLTNENGLSIYIPTSVGESDHMFAALYPYGATREINKDGDRVHILISTDGTKQLLVQLGGEKLYQQYVGIYRDKNNLLRIENK